MVRVEGEDIEEEETGKDVGEEKISEAILGEDICIRLEVNKKFGL